MNKTAFLHLINQVNTISDQETDELEELVVNFPYCQTAHLLIAKAAYDKGSMLSNQKLRKAASYAVNRQLLKKLIHTTAASVTLHTIQTDSAKNGAKILVKPEEEPKQEQTTPAQPEQKTAPEPEITKQPATSPEEKPEQAPEPEFNKPEAQPEPSKQEPVHRTQPKEITDADAVSETELDQLLTIAHIAPAESEQITNAEQEEETQPEIEEKQPVTDAAPVEKSPQGELEPEAEIPSVNQEDTAPTENKGQQEEISVTEVAEEEETEQDLTKNFDSYLFKPERDDEQSTPEEEAVLNSSYPEAEVNYIFTENDLGYWMNSSRLGESLQLKDEYTSDLPYHFHPELILEYSKSNELEKSVTPEINSVVKEQISIIDQFLKQNPKLKSMANAKVKTEPQEDLSLKSTKIKKSFASENLANIFVQQGKIKKAIKIYEHLILKIPEKKAYFVEQIEKLQKIS